MIKAIRYNVAMADRWDEFVSQARNSTLLHMRQYMDYHADRFRDASLVFLNEQDKIVALLPACVSRKDNGSIVSHEGLTYGGYILAPLTHTAVVEEVFNASLQYYRNNMKADILVIKHIPYIYNSQPCDEELYFIHRQGGQLIERGLSQAIDISAPLPMNKLRQRCLTKARNNNIKVAIACSQDDWTTFHQLLTNVLRRHNTAPVHTADELWTLHSRFPQQIVLYGAYKDNCLVAGTILYHSPTVTHTQYLAASDIGKECGALDLVIHEVTHDNAVKTRRYLDFGISSEHDGTLNHGLTLQKEGFGARGVCYDIYKITL
ncbi:MAG: GNAT family N-acetyltransferase [Bacteroidaceae bacterium]|nr:GNAT family N-acetyltransferase [Bacteroidaceae bacterium]